jgi:hypothetical protein
LIGVAVGSNNEEVSSVSSLFKGKLFDFRVSANIDNFSQIITE